MKIAFLNIYNGVIDRGAETFVKEVASRLSERHQITVFQSGDSMGENYEVKKIPIKWNWNNKSAVGTVRSRFFIDYWNRQVAKFTFKLLPRIYKGKYDVVIPINGGWMPALIRLVTWLYGGKMIISGQSGIGWDDRNNLWCFPDVFVAISSRAKTWAKRANPLVRVEYIPNGVDLNKFTAKDEKYQTELKKPVVLCVGALTKSKRIDLEIKAAARLAGVSLLVAGDGDLREELKVLGTRLLGNKFQLVKVAYGEMPKVYRNADVFTLPSEKSEAFGNVLVEAMASGLPVVANNDSIRREIVGDAGILVDPIDTDEYARALEKALKVDWGDKSRKQAEKFSWDKIAEKYEKLFLEIT